MKTSLIALVLSCASLLASDVAEGQATDRERGASTRPVEANSALPDSFAWTSSDLLVSPPPHPSREIISIKDPSIVRHDGAWHIYATTADADANGNWRMVYLNFADWDQAGDARAVHLDVVNRHFTGYHCAPQVFYFEPHEKWYLIYQSQQPQYSTTNDLSDPSSWTDGTDFFDGKPANTPDLWIDYWVVCDDTHAYLFFTGDDGKLYRSRTGIDDFPRGMGEVEVVLEDPNRFNLFEGSAHYRIKGTEQYLTIIEAIGQGGVRFYRSWISDGLDGEFRPLADTWENPFAGPSNVTHANPADPWTADISHGELLRDGKDQTMTIDPSDLKLLYQGQRPGGRGLEYSQLPYRLGLLTLTQPEAEGSNDQN